MSMRKHSHRIAVSMLWYWGLASSYHSVYNRTHSSASSGLFCLNSAIVNEAWLAFSCKTLKFFPQIFSFEPILRLSQIFFSVKTSRYMVIVYVFCIEHQSWVNSARSVQV